MSDKTLVFTPEGQGGGGLNSILAMIPGLMKGNGLDANMVAALMSGKNNQDNWGGAGCWWIWIILLFFIFGWGGNGFGGFGNRNGGGLPAELNGDAGRELLMNAIQGNGTAINQLASSLNCSTQQLQGAICNLQGAIDKIGGQIGMSSQQIINSIQSMGCEIGRQISDCCCQTQNAITRMGYENQLANCNQTNTLVNTMNSNTLALRDGSTNNTNAILAKLDAIETRALQDKLDAKNNQILALTNQLSQEHQNAYFGQVVAQATTPINAALAGLKSEVDGIKCKLPPTVAVQWPNIVGVNLDTARAAAYGAYAADAAYGNSCGCNNYCG